MKEYLHNIIKKKGLHLSLLLIILVVCVNAIQVIYYRHVIIQSSETTLITDKIRDGLNAFDNYVRQADVGARAYIIQQNPQFGFENQIG